MLTLDERMALRSVIYLLDSYALDDNDASSQRRDLCWHLVKVVTSILDRDQRDKHAET